MAGRSSFAIPDCSVHGTPCVRGANGQFVCPECFNDFLQTKTKTEAGVELPDGVRDERISFRHMLPNRRARRMVMRG